MAIDDDDFDDFLKVDGKIQMEERRAHLVLDLLDDFGVLQVGSDELSVYLYSLLISIQFFFLCRLTETILSSSLTPASHDAPFSCSFVM